MKLLSNQQFLRKLDMKFPNSMRYKYYLFKKNLQKILVPFWQQPADTVVEYCARLVIVSLALSYRQCLAHLFHKPLICCEETHFKDWPIGEVEFKLYLYFCLKVFECLIFNFFLFGNMGKYTKAFSLFRVSLYTFLLFHNWTLLQI